MTTLQIQHTTGQGLVVTEDLMETTSDVDQSFEAGEEIDIDLDLSGEKQEDGEDAYMVEDNIALTGQEVVRGQDMHVSNDDDMADDGYTGIAERTSVHDEDLEDAEYISPDIDIDTAAQTTGEDPSEQQSELFDDEDQLEEIETEDPDYDKQQDADTNRRMSVSLYQQSDHYNHVSGATGVGVNDGSKGSVSSNIGESQLSKQSFQAQSRENSPTGVETFGTSLDESRAVAQDTLHQSYKVNSSSQREPVPASHSEPSEMPHEDSYPNKEALPAEADHHESASIEHATDHVSDDSANITELRPGQESDGPLADIQSEAQNVDKAAKVDEVDLQRPAYVHPVMVMYQGDEISLFPPVDQEEEQSSTYFLQDEQLASDAITKLLGACRSVLGESISVQEELVIDIEELGLHMSEVSLSFYTRHESPADASQFALESSTITLKQVIDIYINLQRYDGQEDPPALYIQLTSRPTSLHRLEFLMTAVREKKGLSQIQPIYADENSPSPEVASSSPRAEKDSHPTYDSSTNKGPTLPDPHIAKHDDLYSGIVAVGPLEAESSANLLELGADDINSLSAPAIGPNLTYEVDPDGKSSRGTKMGTSSPLNKYTTKPGPGPGGQDESDIENEDFIDYEDVENDDDEQTNEASSGSSTLQGDAFDSTIEGLHATSEKGMLISEIGESLEDPHLGQDAEPADSIDDAADHSRNTPNADFDDTRRLDTSGTDTSHLEHSQQQLEDSSTTQDLPGKDSASDRLSDQVETGDPSPLTSPNAEKDMTTTQENNELASLKASPLSDQESEPDVDRDAFEPVSSCGADLLQDSQSNYAQAQSAVDGLSHQETHEDIGRDRGHANPSPGPSLSFERQVDSSTQESNINTGEPGISVDDVDQALEDEDEITYDDDEDEDEPPKDTSGVEGVLNSTSGSLKRARNFHEQEETLENELHGEEVPYSGYAKYRANTFHIDAKRVRSD